jgi:hypothetical protein
MTKMELLNLIKRIFKWNKGCSAKFHYSFLKKKIKKFV